MDRRWFLVKQHMSLNHILWMISKAHFHRKKSKLFKFYLEMTRKVHLRTVSEALLKVLYQMDSIMKEMTRMEDLQPSNLFPTHSSITPPTMNDDDTMVGFDDRLNQIMDKLTGQPSTHLQIIPMVGMGGIGKTTLAQNVYDNLLIVQSFDIRGWVTISQVYNIEQILLNLLRKFKIDEQGKSEYDDLGTILYQYLLSKMYLIIIDDLWDTEAWDKLKKFLPNTKGSRIIVTTRLKEVAKYVGSNNLHEINLLDENDSWILLCLKTFGQKICPCLELEEVGKKIAKHCRGLPLSIAVIGGLLKKSEIRLDSWKYVAENVNKLIISKVNDCSDILLLSYKHLPIHLRPCFLYMGVFPEDDNIRVSKLVNLWVAQGFLKPSKVKTLEEVAEQYLSDLNKRHLIMISDRGSLGTMKTCKIHDLLRNICLQETHKENFILVKDKTPLIKYDHMLQLFHNPWLKSLRVIKKMDIDEGYMNLPNIRYHCLDLLRTKLETISLLHRLVWNLQTLVIDTSNIVDNFFTLQIWKMPHLRYLSELNLSYHICIDDPQPADSVKENLHTLSGLVNFSFAEEIVSKF